MVFVAVDPRMPCKLVRAAETFLAKGECADEGFFAGVCSDMTGLRGNSEWMGAMATSRNRPGAPDD